MNINLLSQSYKDQGLCLSDNSGSNSPNSLSCVSSRGSYQDGFSPVEDKDMSRCLSSLSLKEIEEKFSVIESKKFSSSHIEKIPSPTSISTTPSNLSCSRVVDLTLKLGGVNNPSLKMISHLGIKKDSDQGDASNDLLSNKKTGLLKKRGAELPIDSLFCETTNSQGDLTQRRKLLIKDC